MEDHTGPLLDLAHAAPDIVSMILGSMPVRDRFTCALVCKALGKAAVAATHSIILEHRLQDLSGFQHWLKRHGDILEVLQLHTGYNATLTALPCCAKLQDLLLQGLFAAYSLDISIDSRTWVHIASATKLTSVALSNIRTASQQADVVAALTALPNLEQLTWRYIRCSNELWLSDSSLLQHMTRLTSLELQCVTAAALRHLGSLTKLQHLSISAAQGWAAAGSPGLQELKALTSLKLASRDMDNLPASVSQLTALRQLDVCMATPTALNRLQVLTGLTQLCVMQVTGLSPESAPLQLPALQHLELEECCVYVPMPESFIASCTRLQLLKVHGYGFEGPGNLAASTMLQHLELRRCSIAAADGAADPASWQQVFPGPGRLPHLTSLQLLHGEPALQQADIQAVVACCSNLKVLGLDTFASSCTPALAGLPDLTSLQLFYANDDYCSALAQLTGLRQLKVTDPYQMSAVGLRQVAALNQLTSLGFNCSRSSQLNTLADHLMKDNPQDYVHALTNKVGRKAFPFCVGVFVCVGKRGKVVRHKRYSRSPWVIGGHPIRRRSSCTQQGICVH